MKIEVSHYVVVNPEIMEAALRAAGVLTSTQVVTEWPRSAYFKVSEIKELIPADLTATQTTFLQEKKIADLGLNQNQEEVLKELTLLEIVNLTKEELLTRFPKIREKTTEKIRLWLKEKGIIQAYLKSIEIQ